MAKEANKTTKKGSLFGKALVALPLVGLLWVMLKYQWLFVSITTIAGCLSVGEVLTVRQTVQPRVKLGLKGIARMRYCQATVMTGGTLSACLMYVSTGVYRDTVLCSLSGVSATDIGAQLAGIIAAKIMKTGWLLEKPFSISPKKTNAGFAGGMIAGCIAVLVMCWHLHSGLWLLAALVPLLAEAGDLLASLTKRVIGVGDFTFFGWKKSLLLSHGGLTDRLDSHFGCLFILGIGGLVGIAVRAITHL